MGIKDWISTVFWFVLFSASSVWLGFLVHNNLEKTEPKADVVTTMMPCQEDQALVWLDKEKHIAICVAIDDAFNPNKE